MKEYTDSGCIDIVASAFKKCLNKTKDKGEIKNRLHFINNGVLFKLWCVVTEQDEERLRNLALVRNHKLIKDL